MRSSPRPQQIPSLRDQLVIVERHEHLAELTKVGQDLAALEYRQRELVARVLSEGGSWHDVAQATGVSSRAARRRWSAAPSPNIGETARAARDAAVQASQGAGRAT